jgi:hypothetical protein
LANRQNLAVDLSQVTQDVHHFVERLAEPHHQPGLGRNGGRPPARAIEEFERARVAAAGPRDAIQARHRFGVVVEHVRPGLEHRAQRLLTALKVGNQHFHAARGPADLDRANRFREGARAEIRADRQRSTDVTTT